MPSTYSANLRLELIASGEQGNTWGNTTNNNLGTLLEQSIAGYVTQAVTNSSSPTILTIPNGATGVARNMYIELTGALTAARVVEVPNNKKLYFIYNNTTGGYAVTVKVTGQTGVSVPNGVKTILVSNGTDVVSATTLPTVSVATANGLAGTSSGGVSPALNLSTTVSGVLKGNGTAISAAVIAENGRPVWRIVDKAKMFVRPLSPAFIDTYLDAEWPAISGCVGCLRIEGPGVQLFSKLEGSQFTILGMPLIPLLGWLRDIGEMPA